MKITVLLDNMFHVKHISNKYLVYYDSKWDCKFFLNYKENINNESYIKEHLSSELKIPMDCINL